MSKRVIFYLTPNNYINNYYNNYRIYNSYVNYIHFGYFSFNTINNISNLYLNNISPYDIDYNDLWFDLGISTEKNIICLMVIYLNNLFENYDLNYKLLYELINEKRDIIKGIDMDFENNIILEDLIKFIKDIKKDFPDLLLVISAIGYSMCVKDINIIYEDDKMWSYALFNKSIEGQMIDYYCCNFNEDDFTKDSFEDMIYNGFLPNKLIMGCCSNKFEAYDNYYELNSIKKIYPNIGGTFVKYYSDSPYKWDLNVWLSIYSK
jgi:hypothetical protein